MDKPVVVWGPGSFGPLLADLRHEMAGHPKSARCALARPAFWPCRPWRGRSGRPYAWRPASAAPSANSALGVERGGL